MTRQAIASALLLLAACGAPAVDRASPPGAAVPGTVSSDTGHIRSSPWPSALGGFLAIANSVTGDALLFRRDTTAIPASVVVAGYDSTLGQATAGEVQPLPCAARARMRVVGAAPGWTFALDGRRKAQARPMIIDVLEDLTAADSQRVARQVKRALDTLPDTGGAAEFRGVPVVVRDAWLVLAPSDTIVVARAARLLNLEATAHEELRFVVLEGGQLRFVARVAGDEGTLESWDLLAALDVKGQPWLAVAREGVKSLELELLTRDGTTWRPAWRSDASICSVPK